MELSNSVYDKLKFFVQVLLPGIAAAYYSLATLLGWAYEKEVSGVAVILATFLGLFLTQSARKYEGSGDIVVTTDAQDGEVYLHLDRTEDPAKFKDKKNVTFNVVRNDIAA